MLDGDVIAYQAAFWVETEGGYGIHQKVKSLIKKWTLPKTTRTVVTLSCSRADNFRKDYWDKYKTNRDSAYVPEFLKDVRQCIEENFECLKFPRLEADDIMGIYASTGDAIAVTIDKDLQCVPGWHFNPDKDKKPRYVSKKKADRFFHKQWMTGDSTDGIPGLWRIGPKKAESMLDEWKESKWVENILELYESDKHHVRNAGELTRKEACLAMARCVRILTADTYDLTKKEIIHWEPKSGW